MNCRCLPLLALLVVVAGCGAAPPDLSVNSAWVRLTPPGTTTAAYLSLVNRLDMAVELTGASATGFGVAMIHETRIVDGQARMTRATPLTVAAQSAVEFRPGGLHLMLMQPQRELAAGDTVIIELQFANHATLTVNAPVRATPPQ